MSRGTKKVENHFSRKSIMANLTALWGKAGNPVQVKPSKTLLITVSQDGKAVSGIKSRFFCRFHRFHLSQYWLLTVLKSRPTSPSAETSWLVFLRYPSFLMVFPHAPFFSFLFSWLWDFLQCHPWGRTVQHLEVIF